MHRRNPRDGTGGAGRSKNKTSGKSSTSNKAKETSAKAFKTTKAKSKAPVKAKTSSSSPTMGVSSTYESIEEIHSDSDFEDFDRAASGSLRDKPRTTLKKIVGMANPVPKARKKNMPKQRHTSMLPSPTNDLNDDQFAHIPLEDNSDDDRRIDHAQKLRLRKWLAEYRKKWGSKYFHHLSDIQITQLAKNPPTSITPGNGGLLLNSVVEGMSDVQVERDGPEILATIHAFLTKEGLIHKYGELEAPTIDNNPVWQDPFSEAAQAEFENVNNINRTSTSTIPGIPVAAANGTIINDDMHNTNNTRTYNLSAQAHVPNTIPSPAAIPSPTNAYTPAKRDSTGEPTSYHAHNFDDNKSYVNECTLNTIDTVDSTQSWLERDPSHPLAQRQQQLQMQQQLHQSNPYQQSYPYPQQQPNLYQPTQTQGQKPPNSTNPYYQPEDFLP